MVDVKVGQFYSDTSTASTFDDLSTYSIVAFDNNHLFNMPNDYPYYDLSAIPII